MTPFQSHFIFNSRSYRVIFGAGRLNALSDEIEHLGCKSGFLVSSPSQNELTNKLTHANSNVISGFFSDAVMHTPTEITLKALAKLKKLKCDCVISIGGGSAIGLGKALTLRTGIPHIAIPTTYAGSEMTDILGQTEKNLKRTLRDPRVQPATIIYDVELTSRLPKHISVASAFNAMAHAFEAFYARDRNPIISLIALECITVMIETLPHLAQSAPTLETRSKAQYGGWLGGICLGSAGMALHHKICHVLGGTFNLPHAELHAIMLSHIMAYNEPAIHDEIKQVATAMKVDSVPRKLWKLNRECGLPTSLYELGLKKNDLARVAKLTMSQAYWNPQPLETSSLMSMLENAWEGTAPCQ
jgi:alcohol dehydrogenase class IV